MKTGLEVKRVNTEIMANYLHGLMCSPWASYKEEILNCLDFLETNEEFDALEKDFGKRLDNPIFGSQKKRKLYDFISEEVPRISLIDLFERKGINYTFRPSIPKKNNWNHLVDYVTFLFKLSWFSYLILSVYTTILLTSIMFFGLGDFFLGLTISLLGVAVFFHDVFQYIKGHKS